MSTDNKKAAGIVLAVLVVTVLANVPYLSSRMVFIHDTLQNFAFFHYIYSHLYFFHEIPRWSPLIAYGTPADFMLFSLHPTDLLVMLAGWALGVTDALLLFKVAVIILQCIFAFGLLLLGGRCFNSRAIIFLVPLGAVVTTSWTAQLMYTLGISYLMPLVLYFLLRFMESKAAVHLWTAAILETYATIGMAPYVAPVHLLVLITFVIPFLLKDPKLFLDFCRWRNFAHPLFFIFAGFLLLLALFVTGCFRGLDIIDTQRDPETGNVPLADFLSREHQPLAAVMLALIKGHVQLGDLTLFLGVLPLAFAGYALLRRRDACFLAVALSALVIFWLAQGGWFATLLYYCFPFMNKCRYLCHLLNLGRVFLLLMAGFGADQLLRDLSGKSQPDADDLPASRQRFLIVTALLCLVDVAANLRDIDLPLLQLQAGGPGEPGIMPVLVGRFVVHALLFAALLLSLTFPRKAWPATMGALLGAVYMLDVGCFYVGVVMKAPYCPITVPLGTELHVHRLEYTPGRVPTLSERAKVVLRILTSKRSAAVNLSYIEWQLLMGTDHVLPIFQVQTISRGIREMITARGGEVKRRFNDLLGGVELPDDESLYHCLGKDEKMFVVGEARWADEQRAPQVFRAVPHPDKTLVLIAEGKGGLDSTRGSNPRAGGVVRVQFFSANRVAVQVTSDGPGWLYYADAFHPAWHATVDARATQLVRANLGFKAVALPAGTSEVMFYFDDGPRNWVRIGLYGIALSVGAALLGAMLAAGFRVPAGLCLRSDVMPAAAESAAVVPRPGDGTTHSIRVWCGWGIVVCTACILGIAWGINEFTLVVLGLGSLGVFVLVCRLGPQATAASRTTGRINSLAALTVLLFWVWQTGPNQDANLLFTAMLLGYLAANPGFRELFRVRPRPGFPRMMLLLALLGFLVSIGWSFRLDMQASEQVEGVLQTLLQKLKAAQRLPTRSFIRETYQQLEGEALEETFDEVFNNSLRERENLEDAADRFVRAGPFQKHQGFITYQKRAGEDSTLFQFLLVRKSRWAGAWWQEFTLAELLLSMGPALFFILSLVVYIRDARAENAHPH